MEKNKKTQKVVKEDSSNKSKKITKAKTSPKASTAKKTSSKVSSTKNKSELEKKKETKSSSRKTTKVELEKLDGKKKKNNDVKKKVPKVTVNKKEKAKDSQKQEEKFLFKIEKDKKSGIVKKKKSFDGRFNLDVLDLLIIVVVVALISCVLTGLILNFQFRKNLKLVDYNVVTDKNVQEFLNTYSEILDNYYEEVDSAEMMKAATKGMLDFLGDNYSIYLDGNDSDDLSEMLDGTYQGLGITVRGNIIAGVYSGSPAAKAGMKSGDEIININDVAISMSNSDMIGSLIKMNDNNTIVVKRGEEEKSFDVKAGTVNIPATSSKVIHSVGNKYKIGYIEVTSFSSMSFEDFQRDLMKLEGNDKIDSLIIDLRSNKGGYLTSASNIASLFLEKGKVIYSLEQKGEVTNHKDETKDKRDYKIVVLVDSGTASAAEILAAALHDSYGAKLVGRTTYGKGKVQTIKYNNDNTIVKYTSAKWLRPNGECVDLVGIVPDYEVDVRLENGVLYDEQLDKAIELLS